MIKHRTTIQVSSGSLNLHVLNEQLNFHRSFPDINSILARGINIKLPAQLAFDTTSHLDQSQKAALAVTREYFCKLPNPLIAPSGVSLNYGQIAALAGDYYSTFNSDDKGYTGHAEGFELDTLYDATDLQATLKFANQFANPDYETDFTCRTEHAVKELIFTGKDFSKHKETLQKYKFDKVQLRYMLLSLTNWDHFYSDCKTRYYGLHNLAKQYAVLAAQKHLRNNYGHQSNMLFDPGNNEDFRKALAVNAFADHFLADGFSNGHLVLHRKEHYERWRNVIGGKFFVPEGRSVELWEVFAGKQAKAVHDRTDDKFHQPLTMSDGSPRKIPFYGDSELHRSLEQQAQLQDALRLSVQQIYYAFWNATFTIDRSPFRLDSDPFQYAPAISTMADFLVLAPDNEIELSASSNCSK